MSFPASGGDHAEGVPGTEFEEEKEAMEKLRVYLVEDCGGDASLVDGWFATKRSTKNRYYYHSKEDPMMKFTSRRAVARHFHL